MWRRGTWGKNHSSTSQQSSSCLQAKHSRQWRAAQPTSVQNTGFAQHDARRLCAESKPWPPQQRQWQQHECLPAIGRPTASRLAGATACRNSRSTWQVLQLAGTAAAPGRRYSLPEQLQRPALNLTHNTGMLLHTQELMLAVLQDSRAAYTMKQLQSSSAACTVSTVCIQESAEAPQPVCSAAAKLGLAANHLPEAHPFARHWKLLAACVCVFEIQQPQRMAAIFQCTHQTHAAHSLHVRSD